MSDHPSAAPPAPEIADTSLGPVEYASMGDGAPILIVHGTPGGWDQAAAMARFFAGEGVRAIAPSRPGYLGTELGDRGAIDAEADLHAALLDHLGIDRAGVLCWSGGGPSAYRLAVRHPDRVRGLVALAAVSMAISRPKEGLEERLMFGTSAGEWLLRAMAAHAPKQLIGATLGSEGKLTKDELRKRTEQVFADEGMRRFVLELANTVTYRGREAGLDNDWERFGAIESLELERIRTPTLLVHGGVDTDVPPAHSDNAQARIPEAERVTLEGGTHLAFFTHPDAGAVRERALGLLT